MTDTVELTPAQVDFIKKHIDRFSPDHWEVECAGVAGSQRKFFRIKRDTQSVIMIVWDSRDEDWPRFIGIQKDLVPQCTLLPDIYANDPLHGLILEEDLGVITLKKYIQMITSQETEVIYTNVLETLAQWQQIDKTKSAIIQSRSMDNETFLWESWYFGKYCVTDYFAGESLLDAQWERERALLAREAASLPAVYIHRDFQSENIMLHHNHIRFVDFQGARLGPGEYDVVSLLYDPYITVIDKPMRERLFSGFCALSESTYDRQRSFHINAAQRLMQALGAYGNLSLHKGKDWYRNYIPIALSRLQEVLSSLPEFPQLYKISTFCNNSLKK